MALSDRQIRLIEEGISLAISAVLALVKSSGDRGPINWQNLKITKTPKQALKDAKKRLGQP